MGSLERQVFVISDLHLGGEYPEANRSNGRGLRMCTHVPELAEFVRGLAEHPATGPRIELVINGDMIDFLAEGESDWVPFQTDPVEAASRFEAIAARDQVFFDALGQLLERGHRLTILLGNHDIELCLPGVRERLEATLGVQGRHDFHFVHDGEAYAVGDALIEHGNRYDGLNFVDFEALGRFRVLLSRGFKQPDIHGFDPPVGSKFVCNVFNEVKQRYSFIDLLKPESLTVMPLLLALEPGLRKQLGKMAKLGLKQTARNTIAKLLPGHTSRAPETGIGGDISGMGQAEDFEFGFNLSAGTGSEMDDLGSLSGGSQPEDEDSALEQILSDSLGDDTGDFLSELEDVAPGAESPLDEIGSDIASKDNIGRAFSLVRLVLSKDTRKVEKRLPLLSRALRALHNDRTFDRDTELATKYLDAANRISRRGFRYVLFGHTHLAKEVELENGATYLNSGTWADLMEFPKHILVDEEQSRLSMLREFVRAMSDGRYAPWIRFMPTYVRLDVGEGDKVVDAELCDYGS